MVSAIEQTGHFELGQKIRVIGLHPIRGVNMLAGKTGYIIGTEGVLMKRYKVEIPLRGIFFFHWWEIEP